VQRAPVMPSPKRIQTFSVSQAQNLLFSRAPNREHDFPSFNPADTSFTPPLWEAFSAPVTEHRAHTRAAGPILSHE